MQAWEKTTTALSNEEDSSSSREMERKKLLELIPPLVCIIYTSFILGLLKFYHVLIHRTWG